jgi:hypothetical protein
MLIITDVTSLGPLSEVTAEADHEFAGNSFGFRLVRRWCLHGVVGVCFRLSSGSCLRGVVVRGVSLQVSLGRQVTRWCITSKVLGVQHDSLPSMPQGGLGPRGAYNSTRRTDGGRSCGQCAGQSLHIGAVFLGRRVTI